MNDRRAVPTEFSIIIESFVGIFLSLSDIVDTETERGEIRTKSKDGMPP